MENDVSSGIGVAWDFNQVNEGPEGDRFARADRAMDAATY
jgi:hypothetical protein